MSLLNRYSTRFLLIVILLIGFGMRAYFAKELHPNTEEFYSMLASESVKSTGLPILPSGLFYTHGLLYSIINGGMSGFLNLWGGNEQSVTIHYPYRIPSLYFSVLAIGLLYRLGREWFSPFVGLIAAGLLAVAPDMVLWGSLVRMYSLGILLIPLLVYASYKAVSSPHNSSRWQIITLLVLVASFMNLFITILFIPPLLVGIGILVWHQKVSEGQSRILNIKTLVLWGGAIIAIVAGFALLQSRSLIPTSTTLTSAGRVVPDLSFSTIINFISNHLGFTRDWPTVFGFLSETIWKYPFYLAIFSIVFFGGILFVIWIKLNPPHDLRLQNQHKMLFLFVTSVGPIFELTFFVDSYRQNPKYLIIFWPLLFLLTASTIESLLLLSQQSFSKLAIKKTGNNLIAFLIIVVFLGLGKPQFEHFMFFNPAAYEKAFNFVKEQQKPGDVILTPYSAAGGLYLKKIDYYAGDIGAEDILLNRGDNQPVDRFLGAPWIGTGEQFQDVLTQHGRAWFVVSEIVYDHYFRGDWHFVQQQNMELVWQEDSALVFRSDGQGVSLPDAPENTANGNLGNLVQLQGFTSSVAGPVYRIYLFWNVISPLPVSLTQFVHIRNEHGETIAQADFEPLKGQYPTILWKQGETVVDVVDVPIPADLSPGEYHILAGLYRWDTLERIPVINDTTGENAVQLEIINIP